MSRKMTKEERARVTNEIIEMLFHLFGENALEMGTLIIDDIKANPDLSPEERYRKMKGTKNEN